MHFLHWTTSIAVVFAATVATGGAAASCSSNARIAAVAAEIQTIRSHKLSDAAKIPLTPTASRTFFVTPNEVNPVTVPVNVGVTADTVRAELVILATVLNAGVPPDSVSYQVNPNNTVTVDFIQTDNIALPRVNVREIHSIDTTTCQISKIIGYVHGPLTAVTGGLNLASIQDKLLAGQSVAQILTGLGL